MCSSCGGGKAAARIPGATPRNPILFGDANDIPAQPATLLVDFGKARAGQYKYVAGDGVDAAVEAGTLRIGYLPTAGAAKARKSPATAPTPEFYVRTANNRWVGFKTSPTAERYAKATGGTVQTRDDVLAQTGGAK